MRALLLLGALAVSGSLLAGESGSAHTPAGLACSTTDRSPEHAASFATASLGDVEHCAAAKDPVAINELGRRYGTGNGVEKDSERSFALYLEAANLGYAQGQANLAFMYAHGEGTPRNDVEAYRWVSLAADAGNVPASHIAGYLIATGRAPKDGRLAERRFLFAANAGYVPAQEALVTLYNDGKLVPANPDLAVVWLHRVRDANLYGHVWRAADEATPRPAASPPAAGKATERPIGGGIVIAVPPGWRMQPRLALFVKSNYVIDAGGLRMAITGFDPPTDDEGRKNFADLDALLANVMAQFLPDAVETKVAPMAIVSGAIEGRHATLHAKPEGEGFNVLPDQPDGRYRCVTAGVARAPMIVLSISISSDDCDGEAHRAAVGMLGTLREDPAAR
jgi:hypothetical protein